MSWSECCIQKRTNLPNYVFISSTPPAQDEVNIMKCLM